MKRLLLLTAILAILSAVTARANVVQMPGGGDLLLRT